MAEVQAAPAPDGGGEGGEGAKAVEVVGNGLAALAQAEPAFQAVLDAFAKTVEDLQSGGSSRAPSQTTTPEQGANPNAVPMSHGRPA